MVNSFRATHNVSIFITGSNSKLLSGELATHLSGRTVSLRVLPFNFMEFCQYKDISAPDYETLLAEYMTYGGLPLVCGQVVVRVRFMACRFGLQIVGKWMLGVCGSRSM